MLIYNDLDDKFISVHDLYKEHQLQLKMKKVELKKEQQKGKKKKRSGRKKSEMLSSLLLVVRLRILLIWMGTPVLFS